MPDAYLAALLDCIAFLELSDDRTVDPDAAVRQLDSVAHLLLSAPSEREQIISDISTLAAAEPDADRRRLFERLPTYLGLVAD